jgi:hypothetical protein
MQDNPHKSADKDSPLPASKEEGPADKATQSPLQVNKNSLLDTPQTHDQSDIISNQQKDMEVYHQPDLRHTKKRWTEYSLEFLMIFLAVTLGFFAENLREYISDRGHVRQLASQLIRDLKNDSAILHENISRENLLIKKSDTLFYLLQQPLSSLDTKKLQELITNCYSINLFQPASGAMVAIKNELHLKQFARSNITLYISDYETLQTLLKTIEKFHEDNLREYVQGFITAHFTPANAYSSLSSLNNGGITNGDLRNISQNDLTQFSVDIVFIKNYNALLAEISTQLMSKGADFISYSNKEFE